MRFVSEGMSFEQSQFILCIFYIYVCGPPRLLSHASVCFNSGGILAVCEGTGISTFGGETSMSLDIALTGA
jgi:hypothetical protein